MSIWRDVILQDLAATTKNALVGGPFGSDLVSSDYVSSGVPVIRGENLSGSRWIGGDFVRVSAAKAIKLAANCAKRGDIIFTQRGANHYKQVAVVPPTGEDLYVISQSQMKLTVNTDIAHPLFVYYLFQDERQREYLRTNAISTGVPHTNLGILRSVPLTIPPLDVQQKIAATLGVLDDKIELNRKMNASLEAIARALFRDWFVDFGPTRAKMAGCEPYLAPDLWALFPDRLDSEGRPEGWEVFRLGQIADHHTRTLSPSKSPDALFEHFSLPAFDRDQSPALDHGATIKSNKTLVPPGAVLLSKLNPEIPRVWLPEKPNGHQQIASTEFLAYTGRGGALRGLLFCLFSDDGFRKMLQAMVTGTSKSHQRISPPDLLRREVIAGTAELFRHFDDAVTPLLSRVLANRAESRTLAQTRDLLLPRLMSGELRVREPGPVMERTR